MPFGSAGAGEESESLLPSSGEVEDVEENVLAPGPSFAPDPSQHVIVITPEKIAHNGNSSIPDLNFNPPDPESKPLIKKDPSSYVNPGYEDGEDPPSPGDLPVEEKIDENLIEETTPHDNKKEEDEDEKLPSVPFYSLYRFATCKDILILLIGAFCAIICGFLSPIGNITFGRFAKAMIEKGTAMANSTCPPLPSNGTSDFMHKVYIYMEFQSGLGASQFILGYVMVMSYNVVAENQVFKLRLHYFRSLLRQDIGWFDASSKRNFSIKIIEDMLKIQTALSEKIPMTIFNLTTFAIFFATSFYYGWKLSAVMSSMVPVVAGVVVAQGFVSSHITASEQKSYAEAGAVAEEAITNIRTVVAFNGQEKEAQRYGVKLDKAKRTSVHKGILLGLGNGAGWLVYFVNYSLAFWYGTKLVLESRENHDGQYGPDVLVIVLFGLAIGSWSIGSTSEYFEAFGAGKGAARGIYPVLNRTPTIDNMSRDGSKPTRRVTGEIEFENIEFAYPTRPTVQVLKNFSLKIKPKTTVAIVGSSGSGKSTCVQLIQRFYDPQGGAVKLDGVNIKDCNVEWLRSQIGIVSQEPVLFGGSVGENIKLGLKGSTNAQMRAATCQAYAHDFISKFPKKYETIAGERGTQLSGGEKQRIAISRALIRNPPILLLDEATSALDMQSESIVQEALECAKSGRTTIIIAHRLSTIRAADVVVVLSEGKVAESGSHDELMKLRGIYYGLVNTQEECAEIERKSRDLLLQKGIVGDVPLEDICPVSQSDLAKASGATGSGDRKSVVMSEDIRKEEERLKKEFRMREFIKMCLSEWKPLLASVVCTVIKSCGLPFYSIIFGSYLALFASEDNEYIRTTGNLYSLIFVGIALVMGVMSFFQRMFANTAEYNLTLRMRRRLFKYVMEQDMTFFDEADNNVGQLTSRLSTDCTSIQGAAGSRLVGLSQAFTIVVMSTVMSFYFLPKMAAVTFIFVPLVIFSSFIEGRVLGEENVTEKVSIETAANVAVEALNNIRTVASLGLESHFMEKYTEALSEAHRINLKRAHIRGIVYAFVYTVPYLAYGLSVFYGSYLVETECADIGDVFKVAEALIFGTMSGGAALAFAPDYDKGKIAASRIMKLFQRKPLIDPLIETGHKIDDPQGQVEFSKIKFAYPSRPNITILKDFEFQVVPGQSVAVVGPSGSGKSTMAALLMRFYDPAEGKVVVDSLDVKTLNLYYLRSLLATVSQEPILFDCTIKENIAYGDNSREIPPDEIIAVAKQANIHHFISQLPAAYDTRVGSLGNQLSGGQKQRVAIARALLRRPKILILDEATSALDVQSESIVQKALDAAKEGRTCITVAHRLSSVKNSDVLLVMKDGQIIEAGTHDELLSEKGLYYTMWFAQLKHCSGGSL